MLDDLAGRLEGRLLRPEDDGYDAARRVHNGLVDRSPAVIVRCRSTGIAGLTLGGGLGWLMAKYGLAADNHTIEPR